MNYAFLVFDFLLFQFLFKIFFKKKNALDNLARIWMSEFDGLFKHKGLLLLLLDRGEVGLHSYCISCGNMIRV